MVSVDLILKASGTASNPLSVIMVKSGPVKPDRRCSRPSEAVRPATLLGTAYRYAMIY